MQVIGDIYKFTLNMLLEYVLRIIFKYDVDNPTYCRWKSTGMRVQFDSGRVLKIAKKRLESNTNLCTLLDYGFELGKEKYRHYLWVEWKKDLKKDEILGMLRLIGGLI